MHIIEVGYNRACSYCSETVQYWFKTYIFYLFDDLINSEKFEHWQ